jgi:hypothetical protein
MRHTPALLLAATLATPLLVTDARAETRILVQANGWSAFGGTTEGGVPTCGLETRDPKTGRRLLLQHLVGQDRPILWLSRPDWNLGASTTRPVRIVIDNRRIFAAAATGAGREMSWPVTLDGPDGFEPAFRLGALMRVEFPSGQDTPWNLSLTGTNAVMGAFMGCMRMMVIQPGEVPPVQAPAVPPFVEPPPPPAGEPLRPPAEAPLRPPAEAPLRPPAEQPRQRLPTDKPAPTGKPEPDAKPAPRNSPVPR